MFRQPRFLLVKQGNRVLHKLIHGLVGPALNVLLDHFFQLRPQMNLHVCILHQTCSVRRGFSLRHESLLRFLVVNHRHRARNVPGRELVAVRERFLYGGRRGSLTVAKPESAAP